MRIVISCEHASNFVPDEFKLYFSNDKSVLLTHRGLDLNAEIIAKDLYQLIKKKHACSLHLAKISRLLLDHNRSLTNKSCWSQFSKNFSKPEKEELIHKYYDPYRSSIINEINKYYKNETVFHLSIHSFTYKLNNKIRENDLGVLYDPKKINEVNLAKFIQKKLLDKYKVRRNYPYLGTSDGMTSFLRKKFDSNNYVGIEIEVNQKIKDPTKITNDLFHALLAYY